MKTSILVLTLVIAALFCTGCCAGYAGGAYYTAYPAGPAYDYAPPAVYGGPTVVYGGPRYYRGGWYGGYRSMPVRRGYGYAHPAPRGFRGGWHRGR